MNADSLNKWLTLGANIGVVVGLILLLFELNQNSDLLRAQIHQARSDTWVTNRLERAESVSTLPTLLTFYEAEDKYNLNALENLTPIEAERVKDIFSAFLGDYDNLFYQYQHGYLDDEYYEFSIVPSIKYCAPWWKKLELTGRPSFQEEIERIISGQ